MKNLILSIGLLMSIVSCSVYKGKLTPDEYAKWSTKNDTIYYQNHVVAFYDHSEYELNPNHRRYAKPIQELSIIYFNNLGTDVDQLIKFVHTYHPKQKVEIVVPRHR